MNNPLMGGLPSAGMNPAQLLNQLRQDPLGTLRKAGYNVPADISSPQAIIQHLMNSGQITQQQVNQAQQMAHMFR